MSRFTKILIALMSLVPTAAFAQASIAGAVKDTSGAVLPGVTVEAASPALIEKTRSVVTDGTGQYRIESLRPGVYTVTFTLAGFSTVKREGVELAGSFTATVNADLRVGAVEETITVTAATPLVDVQNTTAERVKSPRTANRSKLHRDQRGGGTVARSKPLGRQLHVTVNLVPGVGVFSATNPAASFGTMFGERLNQLDVRFGKRLAFGKNHVALNLDVYNVLNGSAVIQESSVYSSWRTPQGILPARFAKVNAQFEF
jgi:hypothetical protein